MSLSKIRTCPLCGSSAAGATFPYGTLFNSVRFSYMKCGVCSSVFVDPVPDNQTFARMYAKSEYHDCHYEGLESGAYVESAELLKRYVPAGASVLDYGCGVGAFLMALRDEGFDSCGVEFDSEAARSAGERSGCVTMSVDDFEVRRIESEFDVIHFGDVLEHLTDPAQILKKLLATLKAGGVLFVEGPLEINPSPVYWSARLFGTIKRLVRPKFIASDAPTHLFRTGESQQKGFFLRVEPSLQLKYWQTYETGWPYASGGFLKRAISKLAAVIGGRKIFGLTFGNRFRAVFVLQPDSKCTDEPNVDV